MKNKYPQCNFCAHLVFGKKSRHFSSHKKDFFQDPAHELSEHLSPTRPFYTVRYDDYGFVTI
jgi:hypothetical protein